MAVEGHVTDKGKPDPNVKPPPAVQRAAARAEELVANQARKSSPNTLESDNKIAVTNFDPANPKPPELPLFGEKQPPVKPAAPSLPEAPQPAPTSPADLEHQFRSLKGRYDREAEDNRRMAAQIADMQRLFATLQTAPATPPNIQGGNNQEGSGVRFSGPITGRRYIQPKEEQEYGTELIDVMGRRAMEIVEPVVGQLQAELAGLKRQLGGVQRSVVYDAQEKMYSELAKQVPNWDAINAHPEFHNWLNRPDPMSGQIRQQLLSEAYGRNEASRVAHVFRAFLQENGYASSPSGSQGNVASPPPVYAQGTVDLGQFAAPGRPKGGSITPTGPNNKPIFTGTEIKQFYADSANGKYRGREQDYNQIQQAIFEAMRENRITR